MAKTVESTKGRRLRRSHNVTSFLEESIENEPPNTMNVIVDVHNGGEGSNRQQQQHNNDHVIELSDNKESKRSSARPCENSEASLHRNRKNSSKNLSRHDDLTIESLDLIEELDASENMNKTLKEKPRRRKQWSTVTNVINEAEVDPKKPPRKRWSKDASVIRLPETSDDTSPLIENSRKTPVPAPRINLRRSDSVALYDNPAFVSDNEDEVLRIETDHNRESTKIEMRRMSDRSNIESVDEAGTTTADSSKKREEIVTSKRLGMDNDDRSSRTKSSGSRKSSRGADSSASLDRVIDVRSNSVTSEERVSSDRRSQPRRRDQLSKKKELFKKKEPLGDDTFVSSAKTTNSKAETDDVRIRRKKKKKRRQEKETAKEKAIEFISVTIHRADVLEADYMNVRRPMVRVHIVDARTGSYLKNVENGTYVQPMITGKFDFKKNKSIIPIWEEELIFEHDFDAIVKRGENEQVVILFEVLELLNFTDASLNYDKFGSEGCWNKIAWAFLKPIGINNTLHTGKKVRLQLYKPKRSFKKYERHKCEVYAWWRSNNRDKYPSSLLVTVTPVPPSKMEPVLYQKLPINDLLNDDKSRNLSKYTSESISLPKWARLAAQSCKIPNEKMFETEVSEKGCFYIAFSNDGKYLACVHSEEYYYPIVVYEVETLGKIRVRFLGHKSFVYSLNWSSDDHYLLSASADQTACIWDVHNQIVQYIEMLPHPSYVYCAKYAADNATFVATGCYDRVVRLWVNDKRSRKRELIQELEGHEGFVNCMVFQKNGNLITADSVGLIILWAIHRDGRISKKTGCILKKIKIREIEGVTINTVILHPLESRLLVHTRDNSLRMLDLATGVILQKYKRLNNQRIQLKACISPCGGYVICGSEDSILHIWNLETGKHVAKYIISECSSARMIIACVDYHPYDHVMAYSIFGSSTSVRVLRHNKNVNGNDVGLQFTEDTLQTRGNEVILDILNCSPSRQSKPSDSTLSRIKDNSSRRSITSHTVIEIENNHEQPWTVSHHAKEMERNWRKKSWDRLHSIIEKIDSILFGNSIFFEDVAEAKRSSSPNERGSSSIIASNSNIISQQDMLLENFIANSTRSHDNSLSKGNDTQSNFTTVSKSPDRSYNFRNSAIFKKTNTPESSHVSSSDSAGTYIVEKSNINKNVEAGMKEIDSVQVVESDSSRISNATFLMEEQEK